MSHRASRAKTAPAAGAGVRKPKGRGHERHDEILAAAARMFVELGIENVSTRRIAQAVGISQTTLYVYFPTKDAILNALCDQCFSRLVELFRREESRTPEPIERLRRMMRTYVRFGIEHGDEYRLAFMVKRQHRESGEYDVAAFLDPSMLRESLPPGMQCFLMLQDRVAELASIGALRLEPRLDPRLVAQAIWASGHGLVTLLITMPDFPWAGREALIDGTLDILFMGLLGPAKKRQH